MVYGLLAADAEQKQSNIRYVGKASNEGRPLSHGSARNLECNGHYPVVRWIKKLRARGCNYTWIVLERLETPDKLSETEIRWIADLRARGCDLLNCTDGGEGIVGFKFSEETKLKISLANKGRTVASGGRRAAVYTEDGKRRMHEAHIGRKVSDKQRAQMSIDSKAYFSDPENRAAAAKARGGGPIVETGSNVRYVSVAQASQVLGISRAAIRSSLRGQTSSLGIRGSGCKFRYENGELKERAPRSTCSQCEGPLGETYVEKRGDRDYTRPECRECRRKSWGKPKSDSSAFNAAACGDPHSGQ